MLESLLQLWPAKLLLGVQRVQYAFDLPSKNLFADRALTHSLSSPLTTLFLLLDECIQHPNNLSQSKMLKKLFVAREQLESLYLTWKEGPALHATQFYVNATIRETFLTAGIDHTSKASIQFQSSKKVKLTGSKILFQQMLTCLLRNAYESYDPNDPYKVVMCTVKQTATHVQIDIIDSGSGMNSLALVVAGIYGFSFKATGTGVGLTLVRRIAQEVFGGTFSISSLPSRGTRATVRLPLDSSVSKTTNSLE